MKIIELDLTGCNHLAEVHERIRVAFRFPEWYGKIGVRFGIRFGGNVMLIKKLLKENTLCQMI